MDWASRKTRPFVVGAVIDLGRCFNLTDVDALQELRTAHELLQVSAQAQGVQLPVNKGRTQDKLLRYLDRAVFEFMHELRAEPAPLAAAPLPPYDMVRAPFLEGEELYPGAGFKSLNHVQVAVRNLDCIKGYFLPIRKGD